MTLNYYDELIDSQFLFSDELRKAMLSTQSFEEFRCEALTIGEVIKDEFMLIRNCLESIIVAEKDSVINKEFERILENGDFTFNCITVSLNAVLSKYTTEVDSNVMRYVNHIKAVSETIVSFVTTLVKFYDDVELTLDLIAESYADTCDAIGPNVNYGKGKEKKKYEVALSLMKSCSDKYSELLSKVRDSRDSLKRIVAK